MKYIDIETRRQDFINKVAGVGNMERQDYLFQYSKDTEKDLKKLSNSGTLNWKQWNELFERNTNNQLILYKLAKDANTPDDIAKKVGDIIIEQVKKQNHLQSITKDTVVALLSRNTIAPSISVGLVRLTKDSLFEELGKYTYEKYMVENPPRNIYSGFRPCPLRQDVVKMLCELSLGNAKYRKKWYYSPFRFIKDNEYIKQVMGHEKYNETIAAAIANNCYIAHDIRLEAMQNCNIKDIKFATNTMREQMYLMATETYIDIGLSTSPTKEEKTSFTMAANFLSENISEGFFTDAQEIDLALRLHDTHRGATKDYVLFNLFYHTKSPHVLAIAERMSKNTNAYTAYQNSAMPKEMRIALVNKICKDVLKKKKPINNTHKSDIVTKLLNTTTVDDYCYEAIAKYEYPYMKLDTVMSPYTPEKWLKTMADDAKNNKTMDKLSMTRGIYFYSTLNILMQKYFTKDEISKIIKFTDPMRVYDRVRYLHSDGTLKVSNDENATPKRVTRDGTVEGNVAYEYVSYKYLGDYLWTLNQKSVQNFIKDMKEMKDSFPEKSTEKIIWEECLNLFDTSQEYSRIYRDADFRNADNDVILFLKRHYLFDMSDIFSENYESLYENVNYACEWYNTLEDEIQYRKLEREDIYR